MNYAESDDEEDEIFRQIDNDARKGRPTKRRRVVVDDDDSDDEFALDEATQQALIDDGMFVGKNTLDCFTKHDRHG